MTFPRRPGLFCAAPHPADPTILCSLLSGHWPGSLHDDGHGNVWTEEKTDRPGRRWALS